MKKTDHTLPTMHALALLPARERRQAIKLINQSIPARTQAQATEDIVAALLLTAARQPVQPPAGTLIALTDRLAKRERSLAFWGEAARLTRWSGWGVAAALALYLGLTGAERHQPESLAQLPPKAATPHIAPGPKAAARTSPAPGSAGAEAQLVEMKKELAALRNELQGLKSPTGSQKLLSVTQFRRPGEAGGSRPSSLSSKTLLSAFASSLQPYLAAKNGKTSTGPEIVIERGYGAFTADTLPEGYYYRHLLFPVDQANELGLLKDDQGRFYDPYGNLLWSEDTTRPGTYVSSAPAQSDDLAKFAPFASANPTPAPQTAPATKDQPEVLAVVDPASGEGNLLISNTNALPPPPPGKVSVVWIGTDGADGTKKWQIAGALPRQIDAPQLTQGSKLPEAPARASGLPTDVGDAIATLRLSKQGAGSLQLAGATVAMSTEDVSRVIPSAAFGAVTNSAQTLTLSASNATGLLAAPTGAIRVLGGNE